MKKLFILTSILLVVFLPACKKEIKTPVSEVEEFAGARPPASTPSILQWQKCLGSSANELGFAITNALGGEYVVAGNTLGNNGDVSGNHGGSDAWIVKLNSTGGIVWQKAIGGTASDNAYDIVATADGGYIFAGATSSNDGNLQGLPFHGQTDAWAVKLSSEGIIEWQAVLGGSGVERGMSVIQTGDGGYLLSGYTNSIDGDVAGNHGDNDAWIVKLGNSGAVEWEKTYGGSLYDAIVSVSEIAGGYIASASTASSDGDLSGITNHGGRDSWVFKIDGSGNLLPWNKTYGGSGDEGGGNIYATNDDYIFSTSTTSNNGDVSGNHGYRDAWIVKINSTGGIIWQKCFGGFDADDCDIKVLRESGEMLLVGLTFSKNGDISGNKGGEDFWTMRLDANGQKLNSNVLGGKSGDMGSDAVLTPDGMYMAVGRTSSTNGDVSGNHGVSDVWVVKFGF
jgi:hypothetical protein